MDPGNYSRVNELEFPRFPSEPKGNFSSQICQDVWDQIFQRLTLSHLLRAERICYAFFEMAKVHIPRIRRRQVLFQQKSEIDLQNSGTDPLLCPQNGNLVVLLQKDPFYRLEVWDITTKKLRAKRILPKRVRSTTPRDFIISNSGRFVAILYELSVYVYELGIDFVGSRDTGIRLIRIFCFKLPRRFMEGVQNGTHSYADIRCIATFSQRDEDIAVLRIDRLGKYGRTITLQYIAARVCHGSRMRGRPIVWKRMIWRKFYSQSHWGSIREISINPAPLRIIAPPGLVQENGFVFNGETPLRRNIFSVENNESSFQKLLFTKCGRLFVEAVSHSRPLHYKNSLRLLDIVSGDLLCDLISHDSAEILELQLSRDGKNAVMFFGEFRMCDRVRIDGWNAYNLESKEFVHVELDPCHKNLPFESHFSVSYDGELIALAANYDAMREFYDILVFETCTARLAKEIRCRAPHGPGRYFNTLATAIPGGCGCTHLTGTSEDISLTSFAQSCGKIAFTHFRSEKEQL